MSDGKAFQEFADIATKVLEAKLDDYDPWIYRYHHSFRTRAGLDEYVRYQLGKLKFAGVNIEGLTVLDAGCGFGMSLVLMGILGAREMCGFDLYGNMVDTVLAYRGLLPESLAAKLEVERADAAAMPYEENRFDLLLSVEAISHYLDVDAFLKEAHRVLKPGGTLLITDGNNVRNSGIKRDTLEIWEAFEQGSKGQQIHGHTVEMPFLNKRQQLIRELQPELADDEVLALARGTAGMIRDQIIAVLDRHARSGEKPDSRYKVGDLPVDPIKCDVIERLFDPYELAGQIESHGFRAKVSGYWGGAKGKPHVVLANSILSALSPMTISTAPEFRIVARKR